MLTLAAFAVWLAQSGPVGLWITLVWLGIGALLAFTTPSRGLSADAFFVLFWPVDLLWWAAGEP